MIHRHKWEEVNVEWLGSANIITYRCKKCGKTKQETTHFNPPVADMQPQDKKAIIALIILLIWLVLVTIFG